MNQNVFVVKHGTGEFHSVHKEKTSAYRDAAGIILNSFSFFDYVKEDYGDHVEDCSCVCHEEDAHDDTECDEGDECVTTMHDEEVDKFGEELKFMFQREQFEQLVDQWNNFFSSHYAEYTWDSDDRGDPEVHVTEMPLK